MLRNEVGCVHTSQGLEFDWVGVFIGKDLRYDPDKKMLFADIDNYHDKGGKMVSAKTRPNAPRIFSNTSAVVTECSELRSSLQNFESQNEYGYKPCIKRRFQNAETLQSRNQKNSS